MAIYKTNTITETNINDAWRGALWCCMRNGYDYRVHGGSFPGTIRKQLDSLHITVEKPWLRPLAVVSPPGMPAVTDESAITDYFIRYLMGNRLSEREDYTYGEFITAQVDWLINVLNFSRGNTNQATMQIGGPASMYLKDPPCLRVIDFKVVNDRLHMNLFFRSWDLFAGLPQNLGGLQLLKEYILGEMMFPVEDGPIIAYSSGGHVYEHCMDIVRSMCAGES